MALLYRTVAGATNCESLSLASTYSTTGDVSKAQLKTTVVEHKSMLAKNIAIQSVHVRSSFDDGEQRCLVADMTHSPHSLIDSFNDGHPTVNAITYLTLFSAFN